MKIGKPYSVWDATCHEAAISSSGLYPVTELTYLPPINDVHSNDDTPIAKNSSPNAHTGSKPSNSYSDARYLVAAYR